jgi:hypothetical protein
VADKVGAVAEQLGEEGGLDLEVVAVERRAGAEARPVGNDQLPALG